MYYKFEGLYLYVHIFSKNYIAKFMYNINIRCHIVIVFTDLSKLFKCPLYTTHERFYIILTGCRLTTHDAYGERIVIFLIFYTSYALSPWIETKIWTLTRQTQQWKRASTCMCRFGHFRWMKIHECVYLVISCTIVRLWNRNLRRKWNG